MPAKKFLAFGASSNISTALQFTGPLASGSKGNAMTISDISPHMRSLGLMGETHALSLLAALYSKEKLPLTVAGKCFRRSREVLIPQLRSRSLTRKNEIGSTI